jgi:hypothetical protein
MVQPKSSLIMYYPHLQTLIDLSRIGANFNSDFSFYYVKILAKFNTQKKKKKKKLANLVELALENQENEKKCQIFC